MNANPPSIARSPDPDSMSRVAAHAGGASESVPHLSHAWGYSALALSVLCIGVAMNFIHEATRTMPVLWVVTMLCVAGPPAALLIAAAARLAGVRGGMADVTLSSQLGQFRRHPLALALAATSGAMAAALMVYVNGRNGAPTAAFLSNLTILFLVLGGAAQGERIGLAAGVAIATIIMGAFIYSLTKDVAIVGPALAIMTVSCLGSAFKQCVVTRSADKRELTSFVSAKQICMATLLGIVSLAATGWGVKWDRGLAFVLAAGVLQSTLGMTLLYVGMQSVGVAVAGATTALRPIVVLLIGLGFGEAMPGPTRLFGAFLIVAGAALLCVRHRGRRAAPSPARDAGHSDRPVTIVLSNETAACP